MCVLLLALCCIVALLADCSRSVFTFLRIIVDSCWLPSSLLLAVGLFAVGLAVQTCLPLAFLASVIMAFKQVLATEQTTSTMSERTGQLFTSNCLTCIMLKPQCMAVTLHMTRASLVGAASSNIISRSWIRDQCVAPSTSCSFVHKYSSCFGRHRVGDCPGD